MAFRRSRASPVQTAPRRVVNVGSVSGSNSVDEARIGALVKKAMS
jgi:hypothetical protein